MIRPVAPLILLTCLAFAVACGGDDKDESGSLPTSTVATTPEAPNATGGLPAVKLQRVSPSLSFARMTGMYAGPDGRFYVTEQAGRVIAFASAGSTEQQSFLDIT